MAIWTQNLSINIEEKKTIKFDVICNFKQINFEILQTKKFKLNITSSFRKCNGYLEFITISIPVSNDPFTDRTLLDSNEFRFWN